MKATPDIRRIAVIGTGTMGNGIAGQAALTGFDVTMFDTDLERARFAVEIAHQTWAKGVAKGKVEQSAVDAAYKRLSSTGDIDLALARADLVIEAVPENMDLKKILFADFERKAPDGAIFASNTSSLSLTEIAAATTAPERVVGMHFFNPVAIMPLIEIVKTQHTSDAALSTAFVTAKKLGKSAVLTADAPGFVVNRLLAKVMGEAARAVYEGTPLLTVEKAFAPLGLPMTPFQLIDLVGWKVAAHVQDTMVRAFPERFFASDNFHELAELPQVVEKDKSGRVTGWTKAAEKVLSGAVGTTPASEADILQRVQDGLAQEIFVMLEQGVVPEVEDIDLCLILGAAWPFIDGGASPYLDREGASQRVFGDTFHHPPIRGIAAD